MTSRHSHSLANTAKGESTAKYTNDTKIEEETRLRSELPPSPDSRLRRGKTARHAGAASV